MEEPSFLSLLYISSLSFQTVWFFNWTRSSTIKDRSLWRPIGSGAWRWNANFPRLPGTHAELLWVQDNAIELSRLKQICYLSCRITMQNRHEVPNWWNAELRSSSVGRVRGRNNHLRAVHQCWDETSNSPAGMDPEIEVTCLWWGACLCKARKGKRWMILILTILDLRVYWRSTTSSGCFILVKVSWNRSNFWD